MSIELPVATERLVLRRMAVSDLDAFCAYRNDPEIARYQSWEGITLDEAAAFLREQAAVPLGVPGQWCQIAITLGFSGELVGDLGLCIREDASAAEIGFSLARAHQRQGYAREAVSRFISLLFDTTFVERIEAIADARNLAAVALLERLGLHLEKTADASFKGEPCQEHVFGLFRQSSRVVL